VTEELRKGARIQGVGTATSRKELEADIASARSLGYAPTEGKPVTGINAVAAPVFDYSGKMQLVITVIGPMGVLDVGSDSAYTKALLAFTHRLSAQLGHTPHAVDGADQPETANAAGTGAPVKRRRRA
jgi:DNA-binding IclR family transcriptional regulator